MAGKFKCELCSSLYAIDDCVCKSCINTVRELEFWEAKQEHHYVDSLNAPM